MYLIYFSSNFVLMVKLPFSFSRKVYLWTISLDINSLYNRNLNDTWYDRQGKIKIKERIFWKELL